MEAFTSLSDMGASEQTTKGVFKGDESLTRQAEMFLELLKDDGKVAFLIGASAVFTRNVPHYPESLMGCLATDLEYISGFSGLRLLAERAPAEVAAVVAKDKEFYETLSIFVVCSPQIAPEVVDDDRYRGHGYGSRSFPTPLAANEAVAHVYAQGPLGLLREMLRVKSYRAVILKGMLECKRSIELLYRLCEIALCRVQEMEVTSLGGGGGGGLCVCVFLFFVHVLPLLHLQYSPVTIATAYLTHMHMPDPFV
jgi:hypothetical protein